MTTSREGTPDELEIHHRVSGIGVRIPGPPPLLKHLHSAPLFEQIMNPALLGYFLGVPTFVIPV
jgi:hypothetical protein